MFILKKKKRRKIKKGREKVHSRFCVEISVKYCVVVGRVFISKKLLFPKYSFQFHKRKKERNC